MSAARPFRVPDAPTIPRVQIELLGSTDAAQRDWDVLEAVGACHGFATRAWLSACHRWLGPSRGDDVCIGVVRSAQTGQPWMLLPLVVRTVSGLRRLMWMGSTFTDYQGPILSPKCPRILTHAAFPALWQEILGRLPTVDLIQLERQPLMLHRQPNPFAQLGAARRPSGAHQATLHPDWQVFLNSRASQRTQKNWQRKARALSVSGDVQFTVVTDPHARRTLLPELFAQKSASYTALGVPDLFADPAVCRMLASLAEDAPDLIHLSALTVGRQVQATHLGIVWDGTMYSLFPTYRRDDRARHSPGTLLRLRLMEWCCNNGLHTFDFTVGDEAYKQRWADRGHGQFDTLVPLSLRGSVEVSRQKGKLWMCRQAKQSDTTYTRALAFRRWVHKRIR